MTTFFFKLSKKDFIVLTATLASFILILRYSSASALGTKQGLAFCGDILIPSLFPFMVLSSFVVKSGISERIGKILSKPVKFIFGLPGCTAATILIGLIGGYPTGPNGILTLVEDKKISTLQAQQMLTFLVCSGPAFTISAIGTKLFKNTYIGLILFSSQIIASILIGIISRFFFKTKLIETSENINNNYELSSSFVWSCNSACKNMINMCSFVVLFSSFMSILKQSGIINMLSNLLLNLGIPNSLSSSIILSTLEVTGGCISAIKLRAPVEIISFAIGFAGLCVHFQIFSILKNINFSKSKFIIYRFVQGIISAIITHILLISLNPIVERPVFSYTFSAPSSDYTVSKGSLALVLLFTYFLCSLTPKLTELKEHLKNKRRHENERKYKIKDNKKRKFKKTF